MLLLEAATIFSATSASPPPLTHTLIHLTIIGPDDSGAPRLLTQALQAFQSQLRGLSFRDVMGLREVTQDPFTLLEQHLLVTAPTHTAAPHTVTEPATPARAPPGLCACEFRKSVGLSCQLYEECLTTLKALGDEHGAATTLGKNPG
eukprot:TRINITY_DN5558_c0_g1_i12.p3 TRINITY_DN5558_c0_g1~~TRINITY_DN5558_c0_g1_i12.p3  ORF type:complete len:147 (+),score=27.80 TRINITY_DN5558_c0_g1_i12:525-965(+)